MKRRNSFRSGGGQNLKRRNVKQSIFRIFKIANIKRTKDELFHSFICEFNFSYFRYFSYFFLFYLPKVFDNFSSCEIFIFQMVVLIFFISQIVKF